MNIAKYDLVSHHIKKYLYNKYHTAFTFLNVLNVLFFVKKNKVPMHCSSNKLQYAALFALIILKKCNFLHIIEPYFGNGKKIFLNIEAVEYICAILNAEKN